MIRTAPDETMRPDPKLDLIPDPGLDLGPDLQAIAVRDSTDASTCPLARR